MTSTIRSRISLLIFAIFVAGMTALGLSAVAHAEFNVNTYGDCLRGWEVTGTTANVNLALDACCYMAGGVPDENHNCKSGASLSPDQTRTPTPAKPNVAHGDAPNPGQSQPPNAPTKPSVPKAGVSNPGQSQPSSPSGSGIG